MLPAARWAGLRDAFDRLPWWAAALVIGAVSRVYSIVLMELAFQRAERLAPELWSVQGGAFGVWDGVWYLRIADGGYHAAPIGGFHDFAFFPLWPLLSRVASLGGLIPPEVAATVLVTLAFLAACVLVMRVFMDMTDRRTATLGLALVAFGPGAFAYSLFYAEALFLLLAAASFSTWGARRVGLVILAQLARPTGMLLALGGLRDVTDPQRRRVAIFVVAAAYLTFALWWCYIWILTGDPLGFLHGTLAWKHDATDLRPIPDGPYGLGFVALAYALLLVLGGLRLVRDGHLAIGSYSVLVAGTALLFGAWSEIPRYAMAAFPAAVAIAADLRTRNAKVIVIALFAAVQAAWIVATYSAFGPP